MDAATGSELNATQASLLGFLHDGPATGWDLIEEVRRGLARFWNVTSSHVYRELRTLEQRGLVRAGDPGPRDRRPFRVTAAGRRAFAHWIRQEPGPEQIRIPLLVTLWFAKHLDAQTLAEFFDITAPNTIAAWPSTARSPTSSARRVRPIRTSAP